MFIASVVLFSHCGRQELLDLTMMKVPFQYKQLTYTDLQQIGNLLPSKDVLCGAFAYCFR